MELTQDWRSFKRVFYPHRRIAQGRQERQDSPVYLVVDRDIVVAAHAVSEDLSSLLGMRAADVQARNPHRKLVWFKREDVDSWMHATVGLPHFYDQQEHLKREAKSHAEKSVVLRGHFLLESLGTWWSKVLPSSYGIYIRVQAAKESREPNRDLLLVVRRGHFEGFFEPDLSSLSVQKAFQPAEVVRFLSERYLVPVQGILVSAETWYSWSNQTDPWREVVSTIRKGSTRLVPFRWSLAALATTRAFFKV